MILQGIASVCKWLLLKHILQFLWNKFMWWYYSIFYWWGSLRVVYCGQIFVKSRKFFRHQKTRLIPIRGDREYSQVKCNFSKSIYDKTWKACSYHSLQGNFRFWRSGFKHRLQGRIWLSTMLLVLKKNRWIGASSAKRFVHKYVIQTPLLWKENESLLR